MKSIDKLMHKYGPAADEQTHEQVEAHPEPATAETPATVQELGELLRRIPVRIVCNATRTAIEQRPGWTRRDEWRRISDLVFFDPACWRYLHEHPANVIHADNYYQDQEV